MGGFWKLSKADDPRWLKFRLVPKAAGPRFMKCAGFFRLSRWMKCSRIRSFRRYARDLLIDSDVLQKGSKPEDNIILGSIRGRRRLHLRCGSALSRLVLWRLAFS